MWSAERTARLDARRLVQVLRELAAYGEPVGDGYMAANASSDWCDMAIGLGLSGPVPEAELDRMMAFYAAHGRPAKVMTTLGAHPSLPAALERRGLAPYEQEHTLTLDLNGELPEVELPPGLTLRAVDPSDPAAVEAAVAVQVAAFHPDGVGADGARSSFAAAVRHPRALFWVAERQGEVLGAAGLEVYEQLGVLILGAVHPAAQRQGVQQALIRHRVWEAKRLGLRVALIGSVAGGPTERNALRAGFSVAYESVLWRGVAG